VRFLVDEDFNNNLIRGLLRRNPGTDLVRVQDLGLRGANDEAVMGPGRVEGQVVLTRAVATLIARAYERVRTGQPMPGVIAVSQGAAGGAGHREPSARTGPTRCGISRCADAAAPTALPMCRYCAVSGGKRTALDGIRWSRTGSAFAHVSEPMQGKIAFRIEVSETSSREFDSRQLHGSCSRRALTYEISPGRLHNISKKSAAPTLVEQLDRPSPGRRRQVNVPQRRRHVLVTGALLDGLGRTLLSERLTSPP
jgi:hypothetical protein